MYSMIMMFLKLTLVICNDFDSQWVSGGGERDRKVYNNNNYCNFNVKVFSVLSQVATSIKVQTATCCNKETMHIYISSTWNI